MKGLAKGRQEQLFKQLPFCRPPEKANPHLYDDTPRHKQRSNNKKDCNGVDGGMEETSMSFRLLGLGLIRQIRCWVLRDLEEGSFEQL